MCAPVLDHFEDGDDDFVYKSSHRTILILVGVLFLILAAFGGFVSIIASQIGGFLPTLVFFLAGTVCEIVGLLGNDKAVANIWKSR